MSQLIRSIVFVALIALVLGCSPSTTQEKTTGISEPISEEGAKYLLKAEPPGAQDVAAAREQSSDEEPVVVVGRIGGSENPWIDGRAAFSIVDLSLKACSDIPGDQCEKPWDYCCETASLPTSMALIKVVGDDGDLLNVDARELLRLKELQTVVVSGKAKRDDAGNLTVHATGIYVRN